MRNLFLALAALAFSACGGDDDLKCEDDRFYEEASRTAKVRVPEGLDDLDSLREMPIPEASPPAQMQGGRSCLDAPPEIVGK